MIRWLFEYLNMWQFCEALHSTSVRTG